MLQNETEDNIYNAIDNFENNTNEIDTNENNTNENNNHENNKIEINANEAKQSKESDTIEQNQNQYNDENNNMSTQNEIIGQNGNKIFDKDSSLFKDQAVKDILDDNKKLKEKYDKLKEKIDEEIKKSKQLSEQIKNLEKELSDEKKKNEDLSKELEEAKKSAPKEIQVIENKSATKNNEEFLQNLLLKDKEISELKKKLENCILLSEGEELISIIFINEEQHIHYSVICKNVDSLSVAEDKLIEKFPIMKEEDFDYYLNEKRLKRSYKFKEKNINNGEIITIKKRE